MPKFNSKNKAIPESPKSLPAAQASLCAEKGENLTDCPCPGSVLNWVGGNTGRDAP